MGRRRRPGTSGLRALLRLLVVLVGAFAPAAQAATTLALLPASGTAGASQRRALDAALRKAVEATHVVALQASAETAEHVATMAEFGSSCTASDRDCLQKLGIVAGVDQLLVVEARGKGTLQVKLTLLGVGDGAVVRAVEGALAPADADDVAALVGRALRGGGDDDDDDGPRAGGAAPPAVRQAPALDAAVDASAPIDVPLAGAITAGVGGGVAVLSLLGALAGESLLATGGGSAALRGERILPATQAAWTVAVVGAAAGGVGVGLLLLGDGDDGAPPPAATD